MDKEIENCGGVEMPKILEIEPEVKEDGEDGEQLRRRENAEDAEEAEAGEKTQE